MSASWSLFVIVVTLASLAGALWLLLSNRDKPADGAELDHAFDGIREFDNPLPAWWVGLFVATIIFGVGYMFYFPALGNIAGVGDWTSERELRREAERHEERFAALYESYASMSPEQLIADRKAMQTGRRLFLNHCSTCHGIAAKGGEAFPNLTDTEWMWGGDFASIKQTILNGRNGQMPAWGQVLQPAQVTAMTQYVQSLSGAVSPDGHEVAKPLYQQYCMACHGAKGKGNSLLGAPDLTNDIWLYGGTSEAITASIVNGRAGAMPSQRQLLGDDRIHVLAAYVLSLTDSGGAQAATPHATDPRALARRD